MREKKTAALVGVGILLALNIAMAATPSQTFNAVINRYAGLNTFKAIFNEKICSKTDGTCTMLGGTFTYASPNKFRVDVSLPTEQLVLSDGSVTWIYIPSANQAIKTRPGPEQALFLFASNLRNYNEQYTVELKSTKDYLEAHFTSKPDKKVYLKEFVLLINPSANEIAGVKMEQGEMEITFMLEKTQFNVSVPGPMFTFSPPEGTTVIEDTGTGYQ